MQTLLSLSPYPISPLPSFLMFWKHSILLSLLAPSSVSIMYFYLPPGCFFGNVLLFSLSLSLLMVQVAFYLFLRHFMSRQPSVFSSISSQVRATFYLQSHLQQFRYTCPICQSLNSLVQNLAKMGKRHGLSTQTTCQRKQHRLWQYEAHTKHTYSFLVPVKRSWANLCRSPLPDSTQLKASSPEDELQQPEWQSTMCVRAAVHSYTNFSSSSAGQSSQSQHRQAHTHTHTHTHMHIHKQRKNSCPSSTQKLKICTH